ncbi:hypothetical protein [Ralstonia syzygii]|uniref:hypothetical protein n=1 Tax=Ralstonia syzygii TaxID=28097 RepID=UPI0018D0A246|nr:hypothetical protein [Ralstonia syzygii]CAH0447689.1 hypothetical protein LMG10661_03759 [Ralstonia syzygii subsp. syzygii]
MKTFLVRVAAGGRRLSVHTIAASSTDALMGVLASLEALGLSACGGSARLVGRGA